MEDFWTWVDGLDLYTRELVLCDIVKETQEKGRDLTEEELNEIRAKYDPTEQEEETDGEIDAGNREETDGQEEAAGGLPERAGADIGAGGTVQPSDDPDSGGGEYAE